MTEQKSIEGLSEFEAWLRRECFQRPTPEAYDLAKCAWQAAALLAAPQPDAEWLKEAERLVQRFENTCQCWHQGDGDEADRSVSSSRARLLAHLRTTTAAPAPSEKPHGFLTDCDMG